MPSGSHSSRHSHSDHPRPHPYHYPASSDRSELRSREPRDDRRSPPSFAAPPPPPPHPRSSQPSSSRQGSDYFYYDSNPSYDHYFHVFQSRSRHSPSERTYGSRYAEAEHTHVDRRRSPPPPHSSHSSHTATHHHPHQHYSHTGQSSSAYPAYPQHPNPYRTYSSRPYSPSSTMPRAATSASTSTTTTTLAQQKARRPPAPRSNLAPPSSSRTVTSSNGSSTTNGGLHQPLKIERAHLPTGETREYVVLDDSPTPPPKKRTRAVAAAAASGGASNVASGSGSSSAAAAKKRKVEEQTVGGSGKRPAYAYDQRQPVASGSGTQSSSSRNYAPPPTQPAAPAPPACDDAEGHYIINKDDLIYGKYRVVKKLGEGTFGKVVEAVDRNTKKSYAVKIIRAVQKYRDASKIEIRVLNELKRGDPNNENKCVHLMECFDHRNHVCLVFELLGASVFDFLKENSFTPFPMQHIQDFGRQLITSVAYLHKLGLVHTDLKPENILLADSSHRAIPGKAGGPKRLILNNPDIRLIDFGSATFEKEYHSTVVSTRHYRAPEIILGLGWSFPCDMFSVGCILIEFFTGEALFQTHGNLEHLAMMEIVMGKMPIDFLRRSSRQKPEMFKNGKLDYPNATTDKASKKFLKGMKNLEQIIPPINVEQSRFCNLIKQLLHFDPARRLDVRGALNHEFFNLQIPLQ